MEKEQKAQTVWRVRRNGSTNRFDHSIVVGEGDHRIDLAPGMIREHAYRAVACVNACADIPNPRAIPAALEALERLVTIGVSSGFLSEAREALEELGKKVK